MMNHPLRQQLDRVRRRVRLLWVTWAVGQMVWLVAALLLTWGLADYLVRGEGLSWRLLGPAVLLAVLAWATARMLLPALRTPITDLSLAARIARRVPAVGQRLLCAVEFLDQTADSPALRRVAIDQATADITRLATHEIVDPKPTFRAWQYASIMLVLTGIFVVLSPSSTTVMLARLFQPTAEITFPRRTNLVLRLTEPRVVRGGQFLAELSDAQNRPLPAKVTVYYETRAADGSIGIETRTYQTPTKGEPVMHLTIAREKVLRPMRVCATGGDDNVMKWIDVPLVDPPRVASIRIDVLPPPSTGHPVSSFTSGDVSVTVGSRLRIEAIADRPLSSAELNLSDGRVFPAVIESGTRVMVGQGDAFPILLFEVATYEYSLELTDEHGIRNVTPHRWSIRATADQVPTVAVTAPREDAPVTPSAVVGIRGRAEDDFGIRHVVLKYRFVPAGEDSTGIKFSRTTLWPPAGATVGATGAKPVLSSTEGLHAHDGHIRQSQSAVTYPSKDRSDSPATNALTSNFAERSMETSRASTASGQHLRDASGTRASVQIADNWSLLDEPMIRAPSNRFPGARIEYTVEAEDFAGQQGRAPVRTLVCLSDDQFARYIDLRHQAITTKLLQAAGVIERCDRDVAQLAADGNASSIAAKLESDLRLVRRDLGEETQGVLALLALLRDDLDRNGRLFASEQRGIDSAQESIGRLLRDVLPRINGHLTSIDRPQDVATLGLLLTEAAGLIRQTLDHLAHWQSMREFYQQMRTIHAEHTRIAAETADLSRAMLAAEMHGTSREGLIASPAALAGLAAAQRSLSDALDALERRMRTSLGAAGSLDPVAADTITETLAALNTSKPKLHMHTASDLIAAGQTAKASAVQREIDAALRDAIKQLGGDRRADLARQTARLRAAEKELAALINRQVAIDNEIERAIAEPDAVQEAAWWRWIAERQPVLRQDTLALAESLEQLRLPELASLSLRAADRMTAVTTAAVNPQQPEASQTAATASRAVLTYLVDARKSLARVRLQSQADLAAEDQLQVQLVLRRILKQQHQLLDETRAIDTSSGADRFTKVLALADHAAELANELAQLADSLTSMVAIELMIRSAAEDLTDAQRRLEQGDVDEATQSLIQQAIDHVERILTAIEVPTDQPTATPPTNDQHPQTSAEPDELPPGGVLTAAEVRLLLELQRTLNDRIAALADAETRGVAAPSLRAEYTATARQQTRLAECVIALLREGEDEASKLVRRLLDESRGDGAAPESPSLPSIHDSPTKTPQGPRFEDPLQAILGGEAIQPGITPTPAPPSPATDQPDQPNETETQPDDPLAQQLGTAGISEEDNPLLETARQMRTVASALDGERAAFALPIARQIVIDLELLLAQAKKAAASDPRREPRRPTAQPQPSGSGGGDPSEGAAAGMEGSNEMPPVTDERLRFLMRELWGQLPPKARAQLLQAPVEQFHPRYRRLIEQFYRRLGEQR